MKSIIKNEDLKAAIKCVGLNILKEKSRYGDSYNFQDKVMVRSFPEENKIEFITNSMFYIGTSESHYMTLSVLLNNPQETEVIEGNDDFVVNFAKLQAISDSISSNRVKFSSDTKTFSVTDSKNTKRGGKGSAETTDMYPQSTWLDNKSSYHIIDAL